MSLHPDIPDRQPENAGDAALRAQARLREANVALLHATGGVRPALMLTELAHAMALDLAEHFEDLPMRRFVGRIARASGWVGSILPGRHRSHRVVLARYLSAGSPHRTNGGGLWSVAEVAVLALGEDGVLRIGHLTEAVHREAGKDLPDPALGWDDERLRGVPSRTMRLTKWDGGELVHVATPGEVLDALAAIMTSLAIDSARDLQRVQRLLGDP